MSTVKELKSSALDAIEALYSACERDVDKLETKVTELEEQLEDTEESRDNPEWGNCRRGCPSAYLNGKGFCSPACELGAPRGEFITVGVSVGRLTSKEPNIPQ